jgi:protease I
MTRKQLHGFRVAILADDGFEEAELKDPRKALDVAGAETSVVSPKEGKIRGWKSKDWGDKVKVDLPLGNASADQFDALLLPGGVMNADQLRMNSQAVAFVRSFFTAGKPVAVICHAPWEVLETGYAKGRRMTSWPSLETDLINAGAIWLDEEAVVDGNMVSSRKPDDLPAFNSEMVKLFASRQKRPVPVPGTPGTG